MELNEKVTEGTKKKNTNIKYKTNTKVKYKINEKFNRGEIYNK